MTARKTNPISPPNPTGKGLSRRGRPRGAIDKDNRDLVEQVEEAVHQLGGVAYFVELGKKRPAVFAQVVARAMPLQIKAEAGNLQLIVQQLVVAEVPVAGVLSSPVQGHILKLATPEPVEPPDAEVIDA